MNRAAAIWCATTLAAVLMTRLVSDADVKAKIEKRQVTGLIPILRGMDPGLVVHLGPAGVNRLRLVAAEMVNTLLPNLRIRKVFQGHKGRKNLLVTDLIVRNFKPPDKMVIDFRSDSLNQMIIDISPFDMIATMNVQTDYRFLKFATFHMAFSEVELNIGLHVMASETAIARMTVGECIFVMKKFRLAYTNLVGSKNSLKGLLPIIRNKLKKFINENFCAILVNGTETAFNAFIRRFPVMTSLAPKKRALPVRRYPRNANVDRPHLPSIADKYTHLLRHILIDTRMMQDPTVVVNGDGKHLEATLSGMILWDGVTPAPFFPLVPLPGVITQTKKMLYVVINEHVFNSVLYHLFTHGLFDVKYDGSESKELSDMLRTTCDNFCIGSLVPDMEKRYPNQHTVFRFKTVAQPLLEIRPYGMRLKTNALASFVLENRTHFVTLLSGDIRYESKLHMKVSHDRVYGRTEIEKFTFQPHKRAKLNSFALSLLNDVLRTLGDNELNNVLKRGISVPQIPFVKLRNINIKLEMNSLLTEMDFQLSRNLINVLMQFIMGYYDSPLRV